MSEYALTLALVALVSIGGLMLLGDQLLALLGTIRPHPSTKTLSATQPIVVENAGVVTNVPAETAPTQAAQTPGVSVKIAYDAKTGKIALTNLDSGTSGKITTSSQGTDLASLAMRRLAEATTDDGEPLEPNVAGLLNQLADIMKQMATQEDSLNSTTPSKNTSSPAYSKFYYSGLSSTTAKLDDPYSQLKAIIGNNPKYGKIAEQAKEYMKVARNIAQYNYISQYYPTDNPQIFADAVKDSPTDPDVPLNLTTSFHPDDIQMAITGMATIGKK